MKVISRIAIAVITICVAYIAVLAVARFDVVTSRYRTLEEARADRLFDRGWLPDILPGSAIDIRTANDLDLNVSEGQFAFSSVDYEKLLSRLHPYSPLEEPFAVSSEQVARMRSKGFQVGSFVAGSSVWVFFCKAEGYCEYSMWLRRAR